MNLHRLFSLSLVIIGTLTFSIGLQAYAFTQPATGPGGNSGLETPLTVGATTQTKAGGLNITGKVGIGNVAPIEMLDIGDASILAASRRAIGFGLGGYVPPSNANANSNGDKLVFWNNNSDYKAAIGISSTELWLQSVGGNGIISFHTSANTTDNERMRITGAGNVGIGTPSPATKLEVYDGAVTAKVRIMGTGATTAELLFGGATHANASVGLRHYSTGLGTGDLAFLTSATDGALTERVRILSNGYVSIGSSFASAPLQISATPSANAGMLHLRSGAGQKNYITFTESSVADQGAIGFDNGSTAMNFYTGGILNNGSVKMSILSTGNVGIGTTNPHTALEIAGGAIGSSGALRIGDSGGNFYWELGRDNSVSGAFVFDYLGSEKMRIEANGNVGIGTPSPGYKLTVVGPPSDWAVAVNPSNTQSYGLLSYGTAYAGYFGGYVYSTTDFCNPSHCVSQLSDTRLKTNVLPLGSTLDRVMQLKPITYEWNQTYHDLHPGMKTATSTQIGFIAQDILPLFPELVTKESNGYYSLDYNKFVSVLTSALQELVKKVDAIVASMGELVTRQNAQQAELDTAKAQIVSQQKSIEELQREVEILKNK